MPTWVIDVTSFIRVVSDEEPTKEEATQYVREKQGQLIDNIYVEIQRA